jgi:hypothetical protein
MMTTMYKLATPLNASQWYLALRKCMGQVCLVQIKNYLQKQA